MRPLPTARTHLRCRVGLLIGMLAMGSPILAAAPSQAGQAKTAVPAGSKLLTRCFRAMGGETLIESVQSMAVKGSISMPSHGALEPQVVASIDMKFAKRKRSWVSIDVKSDKFTSTTEFGCDGTTAWELERTSTTDGAPPTRTRLLTPSELNTRIKANNWLGRVLHLASNAETMQTTGKVVFNGRDSWAVDARTLGDLLKVYFDIETRLINGFRLEVQMPLDDADTSPEPIYLDLIFDGWKPVQGIKLFHQVRILQGQQQINITYDSIEIDTLKPEQFTLPPAIQALVDERKQQASDSATDPD